MIAIILMDVLEYWVGFGVHLRVNLGYREGTIRLVVVNLIR